MKENEAFYRYAKALFQTEASKEMDSLLQGCAELARTSDVFLPFFDNPQITLNSKESVLQTCIQNPLLVNFLMLLITQDRLKALPHIARQYHKMQLEQENLMEAELVTARPMNGALTEQLKKRLEKMYGKAFSLHVRVDPHLIGGAIVSVGNDILDFSLKGRLAKLRTYLHSSHLTIF